MKPSTNATAKIATLRLVSQNQFGHWSLLVLGLSLALFVTACQHPTTDPTPAKPTDPTLPPSTTVTQPGNPTTPPSTTVTQPNNGAKKVKISWSELDFQEILYDATGLPVQYASQYVFVQGTNQVRRYVYQLQYNAEKRLTRMVATTGTGSSYTTYEYTGNQVTQTNEYAADGGLLSACTYQYSAPNRLSQVDETHIFSNTAERRTYQYDATGNLSLLSTYFKKADADTYTLGHTISFTEYDTKRDVENLFFHIPLLPGVLFRTNNHGLKIIRDQNGRELSREQTTYVYNEQGYPIEQVRAGPGGALRATYTY